MKYHVNNFIYLYVIKKYILIFPEKKVSFKHQNLVILTKIPTHLFWSVIYTGSMDSLVVNFHHCYISFAGVEIASRLL